MEGITIRPSGPGDYEGIAEVGNASFPEYPDSPQELRFRDEKRESKIQFGRWLAEKDGKVVGLCQYDQSNSSYHPRKFWIWVCVHPDARGRGIGSRLYDHLMAELARHEPISVSSDARDDMEECTRFLLRRGYAETIRAWESRLLLDTFDPTPFAGSIERVLEQGIRIQSSAELEPDPEHWPKHHDCIWAVEEDVPRSEPEFTPVDLDTWLAKRLANPNRLPDGQFLAIDGDRYVGVSELWKSDQGQFLETGLTGVRREYRRRGIALALKLKAIEYARSSGASAIRTWNETNNEGMLSINVRLGFVRQPAWIGYRKVLEAEG